MQLSHHPLHPWILALACVAGLIAWAMPKSAGAQDRPGYYTTRSESTTTSSTNSATGVTTSTTSTTTNVPRGLYSTRDGDRDRGDRTSDMEARYPYDDTQGRHRNDADAVRSGFDDPRNPWDGRYANDHPNNYDRSNSGSNSTVNSMRGSEGLDQFRPGNYGTQAVRRR